MKEFRIRAHALSQIMAGEVGLTDVQRVRLAELSERNSGAGNPLTEKMKKELSILIQKRDNPELPEGAKSYVKKWLKINLFNEREEQWKQLVIDKGLACEQDGIALISEVYGLEGLCKNDEWFCNSYMHGTPDMTHGEYVRDSKISWDIFTFPMFEDEPKSEYWWQLQGYMILTGLKKAALDYCLIDTPMSLVHLDLRKLYYQSGGSAEEWTPDKYEEMYPNYRFDDIPKEKRVKTFYIEYEEGIDKKIEARVKMCREYIKQILTKNQY